MKKRPCEKKAAVTRRRKDPLIDEVRSLRTKLSEQYDHDLGKLCEHLRELEANHPGKVIRKKRKRSSA